MFLLDGALVWSASDLTAASECEFALLRKLDAKLGRLPAVVEDDDPMLERAKRLGDEHERRTLERLVAEHGRAEGLDGPGVVEIPHPERTAAALTAAAAQTERALRGQADVVFQGTFFDGSFVGFADFLVRAGEHVEVYDTKLARHAKVTALLQLAAYAEQLQRVGVPPGEQVHLLLGDGTVSTHRLDDVLPVFHLRRDRLLRILHERLEATGPVEWGDPRYTVCGRCATCELEVTEHRDLLLVAGLRTTQRIKLRESGIDTIDALAASQGPVAGVGDAALAALRAQARLQLEAEAAPGSPLLVEVFAPRALEVIPPPDDGDLFFDFEGDPLYTERMAGREQWNLDYLFGCVEADTGDYVAFWAHDLAQEREALVAFLEYVERRRARFPRMHIHHYASYERTHLQAMTARHGVGESQLDQLLRQNVFVDLYPIVKASVRVASRSYGLKKLEPLYMGDDLRTSDVQTGGASVDAYVEVQRLRGVGDDAAADALLADIADYNRYDCRSTRGLRDWLLTRGLERGVRPLGALTLADERADEPPSPLRDELRALAGDPLAVDRDAEHTALALAAAAIDFHRRERKTFWWEHFNRLIGPDDDWADARDSMLVDSCVVASDWQPSGSSGRPARELLLRGRVTPGSRMREGGVTLVYARPGPFDSRGSERGVRPANMRARIAEVLEDESGAEVFRVVEQLPDEASVEYADAPFAVAPGFPISHTNQEASIAEWASGLLSARLADPPRWPEDPATDLLLRRPPRGVGLTRDAAAPGGPGTFGSASIDGGSIHSGAGDRGSTGGSTESDSTDRDSVDRVSAITESVRGLDRSALAVQGPPGTGKTWIGSQVIGRLVRDHGWRVGVVAQSHQVVEHMLSTIIGVGGVDRDLVAKKVKADEAKRVQSGELTVPFTVVPESRIAAWTAEQHGGCVIGGTAWDFANPGRFPRGSLDLLVIDEAGQFSLADTIAVSVAAQRLLLLGDPQQLPQVSQGMHPEPIDTSALGWIADGHEVLPQQLGYFLAESHRMHPAVTRAVSRLSYEGRLRSFEPVTAARHLDGVPPGVHPVPIAHHGDATSSTAEADAVLELVTGLLGRAWTPAPGAAAVPLREEDLIVVAPYNAQVDLVRGVLDGAGHRGVRVGTVDRFQGQEAVVSIVTLAASSPVDVPRGMAFLLKPNRLNVAISRAQWASYLIHSPELVDDLPRRPEQLAELSRFVTLVTPAG